MKVKLYIQARKWSFEENFETIVSTFRIESDASYAMVDIDEVEVDIDVPKFTQEQFTNGLVEQLVKTKQKLQAETHLKLKSLDEQIESLLAIECKSKGEGDE